MIEDSFSSVERCVPVIRRGHCCRTLRTVVFNPDNGDRFVVPNTAIVITDGQSVDTSETSAEARQLQLVAEVFVIGVSNHIDYDELSVRLLRRSSCVGRTSLLCVDCSFNYAAK